MQREVFQEVERDMEVGEGPSRQPAGVNPPAYHVNAPIRNHGAEFQVAQVQFSCKSSLDIC